MEENEIITPTPAEQDTGKRDYKQELLDLLEQNLPDEELKEKLLKHGYEFYSETDTEYSGNNTYIQVSQLLFHRPDTW